MVYSWHSIKSNFQAAQNKTSPLCQLLLTTQTFVLPTARRLQPRGPRSANPLPLLHVLRAHFPLPLGLCVEATCSVAFGHQLKIKMKTALPSPSPPLPFPRSIKYHKTLCMFCSSIFSTVSSLPSSRRAGPWGWRLTAVTPIPRTVPGTLQGQAARKD